MPIIKSARKRVQTAQKAAIRNTKTKRNLRNALKVFLGSLKTPKEAPQAQRQAQSALDTAAKKGVIHKNKAARRKRQLARQLKATGIKPAGRKAVAKPKGTAGAKRKAAKIAARPKAAPVPPARKAAKATRTRTKAG